MAENDEELARDIGYALSRSPYKFREQNIETCRIFSRSIVQHLKRANWKFALGKQALSSMDALLIASVYRSDGQLGLLSSIRPR